MIPYGRQQVSQEDVDAVVDVLRSDFLTQGPLVPRFESTVAMRVGAAHGVAVNSATSALHVACLALDLGPGDVLWTVPNTFVASANCGRYCGANVDFVDIEAGTWNMSVAALREKLAAAEKTGTLPKVVVPVHFGGQPTDQEGIHALAGRYGFKVLEDASHAIGATRNSEPAGSCRWSDIAVFSFHPVKIVTTGEGGLALTNNPELARRMALHRSHGVTRDVAHMQRKCDAPWYYEQVVLGYNYRMTDIHAALGLSQLARLEEFVERRNALAANYNELLRDLPLDLPHVLPANRSAFHLYTIRLRGEVSTARHRTIFDTLRSRDIGVNLHYLPVHLQPYYRAMGFKEGMFPEAERYARAAISLPLFVGLTDAQQALVAQSVREGLA